MAWSSADWVLGLARLISSAISSWVNIGPLTKRKPRRPDASSSRTSEPTMSDGIKSGVNWMRLFSSPSTAPSVSTRLVLARPGTPISRAWPPDSNVIKARSMTRSWPKMIEAVVSRTFWILAPTSSMRSMSWVSLEASVVMATVSLNLGSRDDLDLEDYRAKARDGQKHFAQRCGHNYVDSELIARVQDAGPEAVKSDV